MSSFSLVLAVAAAAASYLLAVFLFDLHDTEAFHNCRRTRPGEYLTTRDQPCGVRFLRGRKSQVSLTSQASPRALMRLAPELTPQSTGVSIIVWFWDSSAKDNKARLGGLVNFHGAR